MTDAGAFSAPVSECSIHQLFQPVMLLIEILHDSCDFCGCCVGVCPEDAIELREARLDIIEARCTNCAKCVWACPFEALLFHKPGGGNETDDREL